MKRHFCIISITFFIHHSIVAQTLRDTICILQLNDVYEIGALSQGRVGGMARVATVVKQHETRYQTFVVLAGDFVSPSVIGTTKIDGQNVNGRQMVDIMNKTGVDLVTFGNHEFDIPDADLQQRINESQFAWVSSDVLHKDSNGIVSHFYKTKPDSVAIPTYYLLSSAHDQFKIGIVTATISSNKQTWVEYTDNLQSIKRAWKQAGRQSDVVVGLTHLDLAEDEKILHELKRIPLIMGGHEHQHNYVTIGKGSVAKADANAKTLYRHLVFRDGKRGKIKIISELINVDSTVMPDPVIAAAVKEWEDKAYASFRAI
ncbi:MAG: metallophosphoesterase, partial [Ginsengibacter sp.]